MENAVFGGDVEIQYQLATDASKTGIGGVFFQLVNCKTGVLARAANCASSRIIMFISLWMTGAESRYATTEKDALAVLRCLQEVQWLVHGSQFPVIVYTDHSALIHLLKHDNAHGRMARWQLKLSEYDLEYDHIAGTQNIIANGLSQMPERYFDEQVGKRTDLRERGDPRKERIGNKRRKKNGQGVEKGKQNHGEDEEELEREMEVLAVEESVGSEIWDAWKESEWYGELITFLLRGDFRGRDVTKAGRQRIRMWGKRFVLFDGQRRKGLFYKEIGGKLSLCVLEEDVIGILTRYHDCHSHFAGPLLVRFLVGKAYWPTQGQDAYYFARSCESCQSMGPIQPSVGSGAIVHLQPFDMVGLDFIGPLTP